MSEKTKIKDFLIYYISQRVIVFPLDDYLSILADNIIRDFDEWDLLEDKLITQKEKYFKYFLEKELDMLLNLFIIIFEDLNIKILTIYKDTKLSSEYSKYFINTEEFGNSIKKLYKKKKTKYFRSLKDKDSLFKETKGTYKGLKVGIPSGEDLDFFAKYL